MSLELLAKQKPEIVQALYRMKAEVFRSGALTTKVKELIAVAISCLLKCETCLETHAQAAINAGATKEELQEAMIVAMYLTGPSAVVWTKKIDEILEFSNALSEPATS
ncbi:MAG: carboxymuconolactone decarboxylase family protein [Methanomassiliicoccales archaeon]|nr:carboxymuconolactone decarboxylase family protein [Methanomassiliicoccales archaeon]